MKQYFGIFHKYLKVVYTFSLRFLLCISLQKIDNQMFHVKYYKGKNAKNAKKCNLKNERCQIYSNIGIIYLIYLPFYKL